MTLDPIPTAPLAPVVDGAGPHVAIIGGGASGVLMAAHLLRDPQSQGRVTIIEGRNMLGCGIAYSTSDPDHLLNTRASSMSAFPDQPDHFRDWLAGQGIAQPHQGDDFVSRSTYDAYMASLTLPWIQGDGPRRLRCLRTVCVALAEDGGGVVAHLSDGRAVRADLAILATGHALPEPDPDGLIQGAWEQGSMPDRDDRVVIVGSGLSMVDQILRLTGCPGRPAPAYQPDLAGAAQAERARFLRHAASWWEIHRHCLPPESAAPIRAAIRTGRMRLLATSFLGRNGTAKGPCGRSFDAGAAGRSSASNAPTSSTAGESGAIRNRMPRRSWPAFWGPARGASTRCGWGLDISPDAAVIDAQGRASDRIFAIGPVSRAAFREITAIPDIRGQAADLARRLMAQRVP